MTRTRPDNSEFYDSSAPPELVHNLEKARHTEERMYALLHLSAHYRRHAPEKGLRAAFEALRLSRTSGKSAQTAECLYQLGGMLAMTDDLLPAMDYSQKAYRIFQRLCIEDRAHHVLHTIATIQMRLGNWQEARKLFEENLQFFRQHGSPVWVIQSLFDLAKSYRAQFDYGAALPILQEAIAVAESNQITQSLPRLYGLIAPIYRDIGDFQTAVIYLRKGLALYQQQNDQLGIAICLSDLGGTHVLGKHYRQGLQYLIRALRIATRLGQHRRVGNIWNSIGQAYFRLNEWQKAERCFLNGVEELKEYENDAFQTTLHLSLGVYYKERGDYDKSLHYMRKSLEIAQIHGHTMREIEATTNLSTLHEMRGEIAESLHYAKLNLKLREHVLSAEKIAEIARTAQQPTIEQLREEVQEKEQKLEELEKELHQNNLKISTMQLQLLQQALVEEKKGGKKNSTSPETIDTSWQHIAAEIEFGDRTFYRQLARIFPGLSNTQRKVCALIRAGMSSKEIARILGISVRTVETHRTNIRHKLAIPKKTSLSNYITGL